MSTSSIQPNEEFQCPLCQVPNRADAKFCRKCGISREILSGYASGAGRRGPGPHRASDNSPDATVEIQSAQGRPMVSNQAQAANPHPAHSAQPISQHYQQAAIANQAQTVSPNEAQAGNLTPASGYAAAPNQARLSAPEMPVTSVSAPSIQKASTSAPPSVPAPPYTNPECPSCTSVVRTSDRFCCWCGESQPLRQKTASRLCTGCSQSLPARANFCFECGRPVSSPERLRMRLPTELFGEESSEFFPTFEA